MTCKKIFLISVIFFSAFSVTAQNDLSDYNYITIPNQFEFLKGKDQYQLNSLTTFLFDKHGFNAYLADDLPLYLQSNPCKGLKVDVQANESFLSTLVTIYIKDCRGNILFTSPQGRSKEKEYKRAYYAALREAFEPIKSKNVTQKEYIKTEKDKEYIDEKPVVVESIEEETTTVIPVKEVVVEEIINEEETEIIEDTSSVNWLYNYDNYNISGADNVFTLWYKNDVIGTIKPTSINNVYLVSSTQFNGTGFKSEDGFVIEKNVEGISELVTMKFQKVEK